MARVLVTGGAGYVGSHCCKALRAAGHEAIVLDNLTTGRREFVLGATLIEGDIRDGRVVREICLDHSIEAVLHFAALAYVGDSVVMPDQYYDNNVRGTMMLLDVMKDVGIARLVFSSSCAVYGCPDRVPITESCPCDPISPYGFTKFVCERMIGDYARAFGLTFATLRYFNAAGADQQGELGESHDPETHLIPLVLETALGRGAHVDVFGDDFPTPDGTAVRDYVHVSDLARAHELALDYLLAGGKPIVANLGSGHGYSVAEVIQTASAVTATTIPYRLSARRPGDPPALVADPGLAGDVLGWFPERSDLRSILADAWRWHGRRSSV